MPGGRRDLLPGRYRFWAGYAAGSLFRTTPDVDVTRGSLIGLSFVRRDFDWARTTGWALTLVGFGAVVAGILLADGASGGIGDQSFRCCGAAETALFVAGGVALVGGIVLVSLEEGLRGVDLTVRSL